MFNFIRSVFFFCCIFFSTYSTFKSASGIGYELSQKLICYKFDQKHIPDGNELDFVTKKMRYDEQYQLHFIMVLFLHAKAPFTLQYKGKAVPLQAWSGPEGSRKLRFPDFMTTAQDGGKVVSLTHRPPLPPANAPGTHLC